ncbi:MAG: hypothetical protein A2031_07245 [Deltaproteobacteria bacterium RBG_19FT_COMBO_43_11]|nr:MAG: hypothetical protein A2031_07245 [Deltaproteobacteria bacterium RBG_19FT_COMBO_43_11]
MARKLFVICNLILCFLMLTACVSLRFSQVDPEAKDFHPKGVAVFPVHVGPYEEAKPIVEKIVVDVLIEKKWFANVINTENLNRQIISNEELRNAMTEFLSKLNTLNFSDPDLSRKIGELAKVDAFLLVSVDTWSYMVVKDDEVGKVSMIMTLYEASTGKRMWRVGHDRAESYILIKPDLSAVARKVARDMVNEMPH